MSFLGQVADYLSSGSNWSGPQGFLAQLVNQVELSAAAVAAAGTFGVCLGALLGHSGKGNLLVVNSANAARAVPSFALVTVLAIQPTFIQLSDGPFLAALLAMFALAVPPIMTNAYVGVRNVDPAVRSAAVAMGMTPLQVLRRVELPLALPLVMAGARTAAVEVVATATLAAYVGFTDLGFDIFAGLGDHDNVETFAGALLVAALALVVDAAMASAARALTPRGLSRAADFGR